MPVTVEIPLRLRIGADLRAQAAPPAALLQELVTRGVRKALERSREVVLRPRGSYVQVRLHRPDIHWVGAAAARAPHALRVATEESVARGIAEAIATSALGELGDAVTQAPEVLGGGPAAALDRRRVTPGGGGYALASYGGPDSDPTAVVLYLEDANAAQDLADRNAARNLVAGFWECGDDSLMSRALARVVMQRRAAGHVVDGRVGGLFLRRGELFVFSFEVHGLSASRGFGWPIGDPSSVELSVKAAGTDAKKTSTRIEPWGVYTYRLVTRTHSAAGLERAMRDYNRAGMESVIANLIAERGDAADPSDGEIRKSVVAQIDAIARQAGQAHEPWCGGIAHLESGDGAALVFAHHDAPQSFPVLPIAMAQAPVEVDDEAEGRGRGGAGESGAGLGGAQGPGAGDHAGGGEAGGGGSPEDDGSAQWPSAGDREDVDLEPGPLDGEPSIDELGAVGDLMRRLIQRIAYRLDIPPSKYAGAFTLLAIDVLGRRAGGAMRYSVGHVDRAIPVPSGPAALGSMDFTPAPSPALQFLRALAATTPLITRLMTLVGRSYDTPAVGALLKGHFANDPIRWLSRFYSRVADRYPDSVGSIFVGACQIVMLQLLRYSLVQIDARLAQGEAYFELLDKLVSGLLAKPAELERLRVALDEHIATHAGGADVAAAARSMYRSWRDVRRDFSGLESDKILERHEDLPQNTPLVTFALRLDGWVVIDAHGRAWSKQELELAIASRVDVARSIDPLVSQFIDMPEVVALFSADPIIARTYVKALLDEMRRNNVEMQGRASESSYWAFRSGRISHSFKDRTVPGTSLALSGVHLLAHEAIGDAFEGDPHYGSGLNWLFLFEEGRRDFLSLFELVGTVLLAVVCPPLGVAFGVVTAYFHNVDARRQERLYKALVQPDALMSWSDVELDLFLAELEMALSIIPDAGKIIGSAVRSGRALYRGGLGALGKSLRRQLMKSIAERLAHGVVKAFITEVISGQVVGKAAELLLAPVMEVLYREYDMGSWLASDAPAASPVGAALVHEKLAPGGEP
ncbi:MAG: hypothetical protein U1F43_34155 [Myxococcota bacterium]